jgi:hypothetical protein
MLEFPYLIIEQELLFSLNFGLFNVKYLLGNDGEHLNIDSVELVEASPGTTLNETRDEFAHGAIFYLVTAVDYNAVDAEGFG